MQDEKKTYEGVVTRLNQRTITVTLADGIHWNVSPGFLTKIQNEHLIKDRELNVNEVARVTKAKMNEKMNNSN